MIVGLLAGFLSGLFGVGGGILIVPGLVMLTGMGQRLAHGTSLAAIVPISAAGVSGYVLDGSVDFPAAVALAAGAMVGAVIGTRALHVLPQHTLRLAFALLLLATAGRMLLGTGEANGRQDLTVLLVLALLGVGLAAGMLSGLLGVGGGVVMVPAMILLFGIPDAVAKGTSLLVIVPTSIVGTSRNISRGNAELALAAVVGLGGVISAFGGARLSLGLSDDVSSALFGGLLVVVSVRMLLLDRRERRRSTSHAQGDATGDHGPDR